VVVLVVTSVAAVGGVSPASAQVPPSCEGVPLGCDLETEHLRFNMDEAGFEIMGVITDCTFCSPAGPGGEFSISGTARIEFGPYLDDVDCPRGDAYAEIALSGHVIRPHYDSDRVDYYYPNDDLANYEALPVVTPLKTDCVDSSWLHYEIYGIDITNDAGATTQYAASFLILPDSVRSTSGNLVALQPHRLTQGLTLQYTETSVLPDFRYWPEGMYFRLGTGDIHYTEDEVTFDPPTSPVPAYEAAPPDVSNLSAFNPDILKKCEDPSPSNPCTTADPSGPGPLVSNSAWLDHASWVPSNPRFDRDGFDLDLQLPPGERVVYRPLFPQGTTVRLDGPAVVEMRDGRFVEGGSFSGGGAAWLNVRGGEACDDPPRSYDFNLNAAPLEPRLTPDGGILAGVEDLNSNGGNLWTIDWTYNRVATLGCGTLYIPPIVNAVVNRLGPDPGPQAEWLWPADIPGTLESSKGRGLYAGFNYNRNRVCSNDTLRRCGDDTDCVDDGTCIVDHWSPLCPAQGPSPVWYSHINSEPTDPFMVFQIDPADPEQEMVFFSRASGVTGVFDAGPINQVIGETDPLTFDMNLESYGLAFRRSHSQWLDSVVHGGLILHWPSGTTVPFNDMGVCDCGATNSANSDAPSENWMRYWDARFYPYSMTFQADPSTPCSDVDASACEAATTNPAQVCIEARTPIPHLRVKHDGGIENFEPDPVCEIDFTPNGNPDTIDPLSTPWFEFEWRGEQYGLTPYVLETEHFQLSNWDHSTECQVLGCGGDPTRPFGFYDAVGNLDLPYFGLSPSGIRVQRYTPDYRRYEADLHKKGDTQTSYIEVGREMAADTLGLTYRLDYFRPSETAMDDGPNDEQGRGLMLGYAWHIDQATPTPGLDLGTIPVAAGLVIDPNDFQDGIIQSDIGPAGVLRLWGATTGEGRDKLDDPTSGILPGGYGTYDTSYDLALGDVMFDTQRPAHDLPWPGELALSMQRTPALFNLGQHPDNHAQYNAASPGMNARNITGLLLFDGALNAERAYLEADMDTGGNFFEFKRSTLTVDRHIKTNSPDQPISELGRNNPNPDNMKLPGNMDVPFPNVPGLQWDFEYDVDTSVSPPLFNFESLTGSLDLTQGALGAMGFDEAGLTLKYYADGDWYFDAGLKLNFNGYGAHGAILAGNTKNLDPLWAIDPTVADFLGNIPSFQGAYAKVGVQGRIFNYGCLLRVSAGFEVGGWYITDSYGGKLRGWVSGKGACIVSVRGDLTLIAAKLGDKFKMQGSMWVGGGVGFCDEEDWDCPADVLDDDWCLSCVVSGSITGITPPKFKLSMEGPDFECSL
jgi:hypothetical protein